MTEGLKRRAIEAALEAAKRAYGPYSHYPIGACVITEDERLIPGANIENYSYGLTN